KTTTSAMTAHVLREGGLHPSHYVGAEIPILGANAHWDGRGEFFVAEGDESDGTIALFHPEHALVLNIEEEHLDFYADLAAIEIGVPFEKIAKSLTKFQHARRRFEIKYDSPRFLLVDDYGHHPTEIKATLKTARSVGRTRVLTMFQPHRYSRTKALRKEFGHAFDQADRVVITDVYGSNESPMPGVSGQMIVYELAAHGHCGASYQ